MNQDTEKIEESEVLMWGYLPGVLPQQLPIFSPMNVRFPETGVAGDSWKDVCGGGCGFAMAISRYGKLITWGSADDQGLSYVTSGKHGEIPEMFPLPTDAPMMKAAVGWAHCVSTTEAGEVYTWGWKECVPPGKVILDLSVLGSHKDNNPNKQTSVVSEQENVKAVDETIKRRRIASTKEDIEGLACSDETLSAPPCLVALDHGIRITSVAAGGRHTLALSDVGQVWGWGYGGEGQLGLGSRIKMVSSPHLIPCLPSSYGKDKASVVHQGSISAVSYGNYVKRIACGSRHSAVITDAGALLTFGWGQYGQCAQGNTNDVLRPTYVSSLSGIKIEAVAAGLWHTLCISIEGRLYAFGGNQFGQLGLGQNNDQAETLPKLLDAPILQSVHAKTVSCGARHSAILTDDGQIYCWGWNKYGQLGLGDSIDRDVPTQVPRGDWMPKSIACGWWHTLCLAQPQIRVPNSETH